MYSKKRQRGNPDTQSKLKQSKLNSYWLSAPVHTSNGFAVLNSDEQREAPKSSEEKTEKPPPIYVGKVTNIQPLTKLLNKTVNKEYEIKELTKLKYSQKPRKPIQLLSKNFKKRYKISCLQTKARKKLSGSLEKYSPLD